MATEVSVLGLDIAKSVFQIHGADRQGRAVLHRLRHGQMQGYFSQLKPCVVGIEATRGAHYWARVLTAHGHTVRLISPHFVKPFLKSQKKRCQRCRSDLRSREPAQHALRSGEIDRAAGSSPREKRNMTPAARIARWAIPLRMNLRGGGSNRAVEKTGAAPAWKTPAASPTFPPPRRRL